MSDHEKVNFVVGSDFVSVQTIDPLIPKELFRFHSIEGAYRFFHTGLQAILTAHPAIEDFNFGEENGTSDPSL